MKLSEKEKEKIKNTFNFPYGDDVEELASEGKYQEAFNLLSSKYPELCVKRFKNGAPEEVDFQYVPTWVGIAFMMGSTYFKRTDRSPAPYEKNRLVMRNEKTVFEGSIKEYIDGIEKGYWN